MKHPSNRWTLLLVLLSLGSLAVKHDIVQFGQVGLNIGPLTIDDVGANQPLVFTLAIIIALVITLAQHVRSIAPAVKKAYQSGYMAAPLLIELVTTSVETVVGNSQFGAPFGSFRAGLCKQNIDCGCFKVRGSRLSEPVIVTIPASLHFRALIKGVVYAFQPRILFMAYIPGALALWAIGEHVGV